MKYTNVKQLIIKFMGGGIIKFPTRFLRWIKINGDTDSSDDDGDGDESDGNNNIFFKPASIQPKYILKFSESSEIINIEDFTLEVGEYLLVYDKEDIVSLGINENDLNSLSPVSLQDLSNMSDLSNSIKIDNNIVKNNIIFYGLGYVPNQNINTYTLAINQLVDSYNQMLNNIYLFKIENDNMFMFLSMSSQTPVDPN